MAERVTTLERLEELAKEKRAVFTTNQRGLGWAGKPRPAAFIINLTGSIILQLFEAGLYLYEKKEQ